MQLAWATHAAMLAETQAETQAATTGPEGGEEEEEEEALIDVVSKRQRTAAPKRTASKRGSSSDVGLLHALAAHASAAEPPRARAALALLLHARRAHGALGAEGWGEEEGGWRALGVRPPGTERAATRGAPPPRSGESAGPRQVLQRSLAGGGVEYYGRDLSGGVEAVPVAWRNDVDDATPPPFVYLKRCVPGDAAGAAEALRRPPKPCRGDGQHTGAPDGKHIECNYLCGLLGETQRGLAHRLEVYRVSAAMGWGLRALEPVHRHGACTAWALHGHCTA